MRRLFRFFWRKRGWILRAGLMIAAVGVMILLTARVYTAARAQGYIYTAETVPPRPVAIIFGAWVTPRGNPSAMLADRVAMGARLYQEGVVEALLLTGDNSVASYNEPEAMRQYAMRLGVPDSALVLDYAGFRTYDSCYRARDIFQVERAVLVTQAFHLDRALVTCSGLGLDVVGVAADAMRPNGYSRRSMMISQVRELPSTAFALFDLMVGTQPTYLGEPLPIFANR